MRQQQNMFDMFALLAVPCSASQANTDLGN